MNGEPHRERTRMRESTRDLLRESNTRLREMRLFTTLVECKYLFPGLSCPSTLVDLGASLVGLEEIPLHKARKR